MLKKNRSLLLFFLFVFSIIALVSVNPWLNRSVSYDRLEYLLDTEDWENASSETKNLLLRLSRRNVMQLYYIIPELFDLSDVSCQDLQTIDELWNEHTNGKLGLAIQSNIWHERMQNINWENYNSGDRYPDFEKANSIFDEIIKEPETFPKDISAIPPSQLRR